MHPIRRVWAAHALTQRAQTERSEANLTVLDDICNTAYAAVIRQLGMGAQPGRLADRRDVSRPAQRRSSPARALCSAGSGRR